MPSSRSARSYSPIWVSRRKSSATSPWRGRRERSAPPGAPGPSRTSTPAAPDTSARMRRSIARASLGGAPLLVVLQDLARRPLPALARRDEPVLVRERELVRASARAGGLHAAREHLVHDLEHARARAVVRREVEDAPRSRARVPEAVEHAAEDGHVRATEPVDRLLQIPHRDEHGRCAGVRAARPGRAVHLPRQELDDLLLQRVHVLVLVDEQRAQPAARRSAPPRRRRARTARASAGPRAPPPRAAGTPRRRPPAPP